MSSEQYAMYLRKSRADIELEQLGTEETLSRHKSILFKLAEKRGVQPDQITIYHEIVSGETIDARPEMQRLLDDLYKRMYKGVFCVEIERLARGNTKDQGEVAEAFTTSHTLIITPNKIYNPDNEFDNEYLEFGLFMSRREYKTIRRRMEAGKREAASEGNFIMSIPPYGYDVTRINKKNRILIENPDESIYLHMIFDMYTDQGASIGEIQRRLAKMNVPTRYGNQWDRTTISRILNNKTYIGLLPYGNTETVRVRNDDGKMVKKKVPTAEVNYYRGKHVPLITPEQFEKAQEREKSNHTKSSKELSNVLACLLFCPNCGYTFVKKRLRHKFDYLKHAEGVECTTKSVPYETVVNAVVDALKQNIDDMEILAESGEEERRAEENKRIIDKLTREIETIQRKKDRLLDAWESGDGLYTRDEFIQRKQNYMQSITDLTEQIESLKTEKRPSKNIQNQITSLHQVIDSIRDPSYTITEKNRFLRSVVNRIEMTTEDRGKRHGANINLDIYYK